MHVRHRPGNGDGKALQSTEPDNPDKALKLV
jgi:hypothetical protein